MSTHLLVHKHGFRDVGVRCEVGSGLGMGSLSIRSVVRDILHTVAD